MAAQISTEIPASRSIQRRAKPLLGTLVEIGLCVDESASDEVVQAIFVAGFDAIAQIHSLMSWHEPASDLSRFNNADIGQWIACHFHTIAVFGFAKKLSELSNGVFDICAGHATGFASAIEVDLLNLRLRKSTVLTADLGGVAKGYAVDIAVQAIEATIEPSNGQSAFAHQGVGHHAVALHGGWINAGGDCRVFGDLSLPLLIRPPWGLDQPIEATVLQCYSAATSANHSSVDTIVMNGQTKQTVGSACCAAVTASECMIADALTKIVLVTKNDCGLLLDHFNAQSWYFTNG